MPARGRKPAPRTELVARRLRVRRSVWRRTVKLPKSNRTRRVAITLALADCLAELYRLEVVWTWSSACSVVPAS